MHQFRKLRAKQLTSIKSITYHCHIHYRCKSVKICDSVLNPSLKGAEQLFGILGIGEKPVTAECRF